MILSHPELFQSIFWESERPAVLTIENPSMYIRFLRELTVQNEGGEGEFVLSQNNKMISMQKEVVLIRDPFGIDLNERKMINGVLKALEELAMCEFFSETMEIRKQLYQYTNLLCESTTEPLLFASDISVSTLLKAMGIGFENADDPIERMLDYIFTAQTYLHTKVVILAGIRAILSDEIYEHLCSEICARKMHLLFLEPRRYERQSDEILLIVDNDKCEILID